MKKHLLVLFAALLPLVTNAHDFEVGGIYYNITSESDKTAEVTYKGDSYDSYSGEYSGSITIPATVTRNGVEYSVTSIGYAAFAYCSSLTAITIPEGVTSISDYAFNNCSKLTAITIPENSQLTSIGYAAFAYCNSLTAITIPEGVTSIGNDVFFYCRSLTAITLPEGVTSIGYGAFSGCSSLTAITLPEGVTSIQYGAFEYCSSLTAITIPEGVTSIGISAFYNCSSLTAITCEAITPPAVGDSDTFYNVNKSIPVYVPAGSVEAYKVAGGWSKFTNIVGVVVPVTHITLSQSSAILLVEESLTLTATVAPDNATDKTLTWSSSNPSVATVDNMGKVTAIASGTATIAATANDGSGVSAQCEVTVTKTAKVEIDGIWYNLVSKAKQSEVTYKGDSYDSYDDEYSGSITITTTVTHNGVAYSVTSIGDDAFYGCSSLTAITIPEGVTSIGVCAFSYCRSLTAITLPEGVTIIGSNAFFYCSSLTAITIPESVTSIGWYAFEGCSSLTDITIPEGVTYIGSYAFCNCWSLTDITLPEGVTSIENQAFYGCSSLATITLPKSVGYISSEAFAGCSELSDVYCYAESVPSTRADAFDGSYPEYATLHVPAGAINSYKATAPWSSFGTIKTIENVTLEKCATPTINYKDGKVVFACDTEGAIVKSNIIENIAGSYNDMEVAFIPTYTLTAYSTKENYENSDEVSLTICWVPCEEHEEEDDETTDILTIPAKPVLISTQGGVITVSGLAEGTETAVYTTAGTELATATATDGTATLTTGLEAGSIAIVKIGDYSIKIVIK